MKSFLRLYAFSILIAFLTGCSDSNVPETYHASLSGHSLNISKNQLSFNSNGGVENITVYANNVAWRFSGLPLWLTVNPNSGSSTTSVTFTASENLSADTTRTALFYLESADAGWNFKTMVSANQQAATSYITPATTFLTFNGGGGSQTINVSSNVLWKATSSASWVKTETATDGRTLTISVEENPSDVSRTAIVTLSSASGVTSSVNITQSPADVTGSTETLEFGKEGGSKSISINSEATWEAKTSDSWITVTPLSGDAGTHNLIITALENNSVAQRNGYVYVIIGSSSKLQIPIVQKGLYIEVNPNSLSFSADAESKQIDVSSNTDWKIISLPDWLSSNTQTGENSQTIIVTSNKNTSASSRNGIIKFGKEGLSLFANVDVVQEGLNLSVDNNSLQFSDKASSQNVTINTIAEWSVSSSDSWVHLSRASGIGTSVIVVSVDENTGEASRTGSIRVTAGELSQTVAVVQQGKYFNISETDKTFTSKGGTLQVSFSTNESWTASLAEDVSWLSLSSTSGNGDAVINVTASDNASMKSRENAIIITPSNSQGVRIAIKQSGRYMTVSTSSISFGKDGGVSEDIKISTDGAISISKNASWFSIDKMNEYQFTVKAEKNDDSGRDGKIIISMTGLSNSEQYSTEIAVEQDGNDLTGYINGHAYVDMGLPSGTLWARVNIGANNPTDAGIYFQWGGVRGGDEGNPCKDLLTSIQGTNHDAATVLWGANWCIPNNNQVDELFKYSTTEQATINGINGFKVTSKKNGNTLFFPRGGFYDNSGAFHEGGMYYWTSEPNEYISSQACYYYLEAIRTVNKANRLPIRAIVK